MLSYWEKQSLLNYDIIIIGSGIVGLSTAISLKENDASIRVLVLERAILPTGASTKNAGFACIGSLTEMLDDLTTMSEDEILQLLELRYKGLRRLRTRLGEKNIDYAENGSYELISEREENCLDELVRINQLIKPILRQDAFSICNERILEFGFKPSYTKYLIKNNLEGELHTGKMMRTLIDLCLMKGIEIKTGCEVLKVEEENKEVKVVVSHSHLKEEIVFSAPRVAICTNAFTRQFYPELDIQPGRGQVVITQPIPDLKFKGIFHFNKGYYYFRELNSRVLFGGGRNIDFDGEQTTEFAFNEKIRNDLVDKLETIILPNTKVKIEDWWTGIMAFGESKFPLLVKQSEKIFLGVRMGGMGVAMGSEVGEELANMILKER
ncbi:MAG: FAD-dependent oxidoreductase [Bacteroidota bacterium]